jgi:hypothetical protein
VLGRSYNLVSHGQVEAEGHERSCPWESVNNIQNRLPLPSVAAHLRLSTILIPLLCPTIPTSPRFIKILFLPSYSVIHQPRSELFRLFRASSFFSLSYVLLSLSQPHKPALQHLMDSQYIDSSVQDSQQSRSRSNSHLSATAAQFQGLNITSNNQQESSTPDFRPASPPTIQSSHPSPRTFIATPVPQQCTPFPLLTDSDLGDDWNFLSDDNTGSAPLLRLDPAQTPIDQPSSGHHRSTSRSNSNPVNMSTLGIQQYNAGFDPSMQANLRHTYTWPRKF